EGCAGGVDGLLGIARARLRTGADDLTRARIDALAPRTIARIHELTTDQHLEMGHEVSCNARFGPAWCRSRDCRPSTGPHLGLVDAIVCDSLAATATRSPLPA